MATKTWKAGNWTTGTWDPSAPVAGDDVIIDIAGAATINTNTVWLKSVTTTTAGSTIRIPTGRSLNVNDGITLTAGSRINLTGGLINDNAGITIQKGALLVGRGEVDATTITNDGSIRANADGTLTINADITGSGTLVVGASTFTSILVLNGTSTAGSVRWGGAAGSTLEIGVNGSLDVTDGKPSLLHNHILKLDGPNSTFTTHNGDLFVDVGGSIRGQGVINLGSGNLNGAGSLTATGGTLTVTASIDTTGTAGTFHIQNGATLNLVGNVGTASIKPDLYFDTANMAETFQAAGVVMTHVHLNTVTGFASYDGTYLHSDKIILQAFAAGDYISSRTATSITIHAATGPQAYTINFAAGTNTAAIKLVYNGLNDELTICFYPDTMIRTPSGEVAVETLKPGDLVLTHDGREVPVAWLGRQTVSTFFSRKERVLPIRIKAGALAENVPARDLLVSPDHAMFVDGILANAGALVNDTSITRETNVPTVFTYYHVEVEDHSLILAEGAPAETFVDNVERMHFDNWEEHEALYPEGKAVTELPYPRAKSRRQVPVDVRVALAARAEAIGASAEAGAAVA